MDGERTGPGVQLLDRRPATRRVAVVLVWGLATALGLAVAATTRIGPVVLRVTSSHGVHLGDVLAFALAYAAAGLVTLWLLAGRAR